MRSAWCDVGIEQRLTRSSGFETGLLLGQCFDSAPPLLLHSIPTPPEPYSDGRPCWCYETPQWILAHALQLSRLTVGGLHIVGVYCIDSADGLRALTAASSSSHQSICSLLSSLPLPLSPPSTAPRFLLTSTGSKLSCDYLLPSPQQQQSATQHSLSLRHAQLKVQALLPSLHCFRCRFHLDFLCAVDGAQGGGSRDGQTREGLLSASIMQVVERTRELMQAAVAVVDGERLEADATLESLYGGSGGETKGRKRAKAKGRTSRREEKQERQTEEQQDDDAATSVIHEVELYTPLHLLSPAPAATSPPSSSLLRLRGCFLCIAYVHATATVRDAVAALQFDLLSSLSSRLSLLLDESEEEEEWGDPAPTTREMGRRLLLSRPLPLCDYLTEDETAETALERIARLTGAEALQPQDVMETEAAAVIGEEEARCDREWKARKAVAERERKQAAAAEAKAESRAAAGSEAVIAEAVVKPAVNASALPLRLDANRLLLSCFIAALVAATVGFGLQLRFL